ncbi:hypothetical protein NAD41_002348 [Salmonella enterica]|nr:hypothetical protein [Salmonella enterica]EKK6596316.1 hypothetical protein [Salmonella enterica]
MLIPSILISWLVACGLGVFCTWMLRSMAAGFVMGFALVIFYWLLMWMYPASSIIRPFIVQ